MLRWSCLALLTSAGTLAAAGLDTDLNQGELRLGPADSPVHVAKDIRIAEGAKLWIEAGTELRFAEGASLVVEGELHALGEKRLPVRFVPAEEGQRWGNVKILGDKDLPCYDGDHLYIPDAGGSRLLHCEFSGGGKVVDDSYDGGALYLNGSAPIVRGCLFTDNEAERGGALVCYNFATPLVEDCTFERNHSLLDDGGAIYCFFYSDAQITRNFIVGNEAGRHGGGIYVSVSDPLISENAFIDNRAGRWAGALYVSSSSPSIVDNAFFENEAEERSTGIVLQSDCRPRITGNSLQTGGIEILGLNLSYDLDVQKNWWGSTDDYQLTGKVEQRGRGEERRINMEPWLDRPVNNLLTQPVDIQSIHAMTDPAWRDTLAFDLVENIVARLQITAVDRNPYAVDQTSAEVRLLERPEERFTLIFRESDKASGVFRARLSIGMDSEDYRTLDAKVGQHVLFTSSADDLVTRHYRIDEARPVVHALSILSDPDPSHLTEHQLRVSWDYFDLRGEGQEGIQLQLAQDPVFSSMVWDSQPQTVATELRDMRYGGPSLVDGEKYFIRLRAKGGAAWSAWQTFMVRSDNPDYSIRLNSLPKVPGLLAPADESILPLLVPELQAEAVSDREGDVVGYHFQLAGDPYFQRILHESDAHILKQPLWSPPSPLEDNGQYWWRLRVYDEYEWGTWSQARSFALNPVEEPPFVFALEGPEGEIADVLPEFYWQAAQDPDPGAKLSYTFLIGAAEDLSDAERIPDLETLKYSKRAEIANLSTLYWAVEAVDNTGRRTRSQQVNRVFVDTTPSIPVARFPEGNDEIRAEESFRIDESQDPWPEDQLVYEIQITGDGDFSRPLLHWQGLELAELTATGIHAYPEARLMNDDQRYFWRVRAVDNHQAASDWSRVKSFWFNRRNNAPSTPAGDLIPADMAVIREAPALSWPESSDPDNSDTSASLRYVIQLSREAEFAGEIQEHVVQGDTRLDLKGLIGDNSRWFWRVMARDDEMASSDWSDTRSLVYNRVEDAPAGLAFLEPARGATWVKLDHVLLSWTQAEDEDWNSSLEYHWNLSAAENPAVLLASGSTMATQARIATVLSSRKDYLLGLKVVDDTGLEQVLEARRITVDSHPVAPRVTSLAEEFTGADKLSWNEATDPDPDDVLQYRITIRDNAGRAQVDVAGWPGTEATLGRLFGADQLLDDTVYTLTVTAVDTHKLEGVSTEHAFWFNRENDAPSIPAFGPEMSQEPVLRRVDPTLPFQPGVDPDHSDPVSSLSHEVQLAGSAAFSSARTVRVAAGQTQITGLNLGDNTRWFMRLRCLDDEGSASAWSEAASLLVNLEEEPPTQPVLVSPGREASLYDLNGLELEFQPATDPDVDARILYDLRILDDGGRELLNRQVEGSPQRLDLQFESGSTYSLRLKAVDETGLESALVESRFQVDTQPSQVLLGGRAGSIVAPGSKLSWSPATDPDPRDKLIYEVQFSATQDFSSPLSKEQSQASYTLERGFPMSENRSFHMRVRAVDPHQISGAWSEPLQLVLNAINDAPVWQGDLKPAVGIMRDNEPEIRWSMPTDPDPGEQKLMIEMQVAADASFSEVLATKKVNAAQGGVRQKLRENKQRFLRARAVDEDGSRSEWSAVRAYIVNAREEDPTAITLYEPAMGSRLEPGNILFRWSESTDPDPEDSVRYKLVLQSELGREELELEGTETRVQLAAGEWSWTVQAVDTGGNMSDAASARLIIRSPEVIQP